MPQPCYQPIECAASCWLDVRWRDRGVRVSAGYFLRTEVSPSQRSFQGCMQLIQVDEQPVDLAAVEQGMLGAFENVSLDMCAIVDRSGSAD